MNLLRSITQLSVRHVSSKYPKPKPRHFKRRWFEAAVSPVMPETIVQCTPPGIIYQQKLKEAKEYSNVELALVKLVKKYIQDEEYRMMAICQLMPVAGRTLHFSKNQFRLKGLEFRGYGNRIMKKMLEGTPLCSVENVFVGTNCILLGKDIEAIRTVIKECNKLNWIFPLVFVMDSRVISVKEAESFVSSMDFCRSETASILDAQLSSVPRSLDTIPNSLVSSLSTYVSSQNPQ